MEKEDALELMVSSANVNEWNINRNIVIQSFQGKEEREFSFIISDVEVTVTTSLPDWFFSIINSGKLCKETIGKDYYTQEQSSLHSYIKDGKLFYTPSESLSIYRVNE